MARALPRCRPAARPCARYYTTLVDHTVVSFDAWRARLMGHAHERDSSGHSEAARASSARGQNLALDQLASSLRQHSVGRKSSDVVAVTVDDPPRAPAASRPPADKRLIAKAAALASDVADLLFARPKASPPSPPALRRVGSEPAMPTCAVDDGPTSKRKMKTSSDLASSGNGTPYV